ncbi:MAG: tape measure protein, partial [Alcaligenaceae bacterium]|nr:tape measure protein [Alcaligenaceae bacterium]
MTETASLVIKTDSTDVTRAKGELDRLTDAGGRTEEAAKRVQRSWEQAAQRVASEMTALNSRVDVLNGTQSKMLAAVERVASQMDRMAAAYDRSTRAAEQASRSYGDVGREAGASAAGVDRVNRSLMQTETTATAAGASIRRHLLAAVGGLSAMRLIDVADNWGQMASRIRMATDSAEEYAQVQVRMVESANRTYRNITETREAFVQLSPVLRQMGMSLGESMDAIDAFSGLMVVNAASTDRGADAMRALSVALQKGKLDADGWVTIYSTLDSIVDVLAQHSGLAAEEIRKLGANGELSVQMLAQALAGRMDPIMRQVEEMPTTVRDAMNNVGNAFTEYIGKANEANGITATMADGIVLLGENLAGVLNVALVAGAAGMARYAAGVSVATAQTVAKTLQVRVAAADELKLAQAQLATAQASVVQTRAMQGLTATMAQQTAAANALAAAEQRVAAAKVGLAAAGRSVLAVLGGPAGIAITAGLVAASFMNLGSSANEGSKGVDLLTKSFNELDAAQTRQALKQLQEPYQQTREEVAKYAAQVEYLNMQLNQFPNSAMAKEWNDRLVDARGNLSTASKELTGYIQKMMELEGQMSRLQTASNAAPLAATSEMAAKYLERLSDQALTAGLKTQTEQLDAMVAAGKLVFTPDDLVKAQAYAGKIDAANAALKSKNASLKESNATLRSAQTAYASLTASIQAKIEENNLEIAVGQKAGEVDRIRIKLDQDLAAGKIKLSDAQKSSVDMALKALKTSESELAISRMIQASRKKELDLSVNAVKAAYDEAQRNEELFQTFGMSADALERLTVARLRDQLAQKDSLQLNDEQVKALELLIDAHDRNAVALQNVDFMEKQKAAWEQWSRDVEGIFQQVGQSLTDAIFEGGKSGRDLVKDLFKTLTLRVLINPVMNSIQGQVTQSLGSAFGYQNPQQQGGVDAMGLARGAKGLYDSYSTGSYG